MNEKVPMPEVQFGGRTLTVQTTDVFGIRYRVDVMIHVTDRARDTVNNCTRPASLLTRANHQK